MLRTKLTYFRERVTTVDFFIFKPFFCDTLLLCKRLVHISKEAQLFKCRDFNSFHGFFTPAIAVKREYNGLNISISFLPLDYQTNYPLMKNMRQFTYLNSQNFRLTGVKFGI